MSNNQISSNQDSIYIMICHGRSGSTLLRLLLNTHSQIYAPEEPWLFFWYHQSLHHDDFASLAYNHFLDDDKTAVYKDFIHSIVKRKLNRANKPIFVDKTPRNNEILDFIDSIDNRFKYIYLIRDLRAVACSELYRGNSFKSVCKNRLMGNYFKSIKRIKNTQRKIDDFIARLDKNRLFVLKYEELVSFPKKVLRFLFDWMNIEYEDVTTYKNKQEIFGDTNTMQHDRPHILSVDKWNKKLLWSEKKYFDWYMGEMNREVLSKNSSYPVESLSKGQGE
jgi:hypothetical protein